MKVFSTRPLVIVPVKATAPVLFAGAVVLLMLKPVWVPWLRLPVPYVMTGLVLLPVP